jgi:hypothetical protein
MEHASGVVMSERETSERDTDRADEDGEHTREGAGGKQIPADSPLDTSMKGEDPEKVAERATPPTEGPAAAGALPG